MKYLILLLTIIIFFNGCSQKNIQQNTYKDYLNKKIEKLSNLIGNSSPYIDKSEAKDLAENAVVYSNFLANEYGVDTFPLFHNTLINLNIKKRGYCYHYANDLLSFLKKKKYKTFKIIKIVSKRGEYFEHTSLVLTRKDIEFENSIVLDAWRDAGDLYFSKIKNDKRYKWEIK